VNYRNDFVFSGIEGFWYKARGVAEYTPLFLWLFLAIASI
jgi:hypothetical protein